MSSIIEIEYIYLIQVRASLKNNDKIFKVGKTKQKMFTRINSYPRDSILLLQINCDNCDVNERNILTIFKDKYFQCTEIGLEYFKGDYRCMMDDIYNIINQSKYNIEINDEIKNMDENTEIIHHDQIEQIEEILTPQKVNISSEIIISDIIKTIIDPNTSQKIQNVKIGKQIQHIMYNVSEESDISILMKIDDKLDIFLTNIQYIQNIIILQKGLLWNEIKNKVASKYGQNSDFKRLNKKASIEYKNLIKLKCDRSYKTVVSWIQFYRICLEYPNIIFCGKPYFIVTQNITNLRKAIELNPFIEKVNILMIPSSFTSEIIKVEDNYDNEFDKYIDFFNQLFNKI